MNYLHAYHTGNHADVFKHIVLVQLFQYLLKKPQAFCYIDTHAGLPIYDLSQPEPQKTGEFKEGIAKIWDNTPLPSEITDYFAVLKAVNPTDKLNYYLGSSGIAQRLLRPIDQAILFDLQPEVYSTLKRHFKYTPNFHVHHQDGYLALKGFLPPKEKRGLVLIDPPYEDSADWQKLTQIIKSALQRWPNGIYAIWFPIKDAQLVKQLIHAFTQTAIPNILLSEFCPWPTDAPNHMNGSGMIIINPPWQLDIGLRKFLPTLLNFLNQHPKGYTRTYWLTDPA